MPKKLLKYRTFRASPFISGNNNVVLNNTTELMFKCNVQSQARAKRRACSVNECKVDVHPARSCSPQLED